MRDGGNMSKILRLGLIPVVVCALPPVVRGETGYDAWLRYARADAATCRQYRETLPAVVTSLGDAEMVTSARQELVRGVRGMLGRILRVETSLPAESAIVLGTVAELRRVLPRLAPDGEIGAEGYELRTTTDGGVQRPVVAGADERGVLYGAFALLRKIAIGASIAELSERRAPAAPIRWLNNWDILGWDRAMVTAGPGPAPPTSFRGPRSVLFENGRVRDDLGPLERCTAASSRAGRGTVVSSSIAAPASGPRS
jgi:alpha-glucuronidase